jgi:acyl-CoA oxidase
MDVLHHFTSGYKAVCTNDCYTGVDQLRQACGGAGFLQSSRIADIWGDIAPLVTLEGVNVVMLQQSSRYLLKQAKKAVKGTQLKGFFSYLNHMKDIKNMKSGATNAEHFAKLDHLKLAMGVGVACQV